MDDLISRQAAIDALSKGEGCGNICRRGIERIPSAERHGHWIENETSYADPPTKQTCNCSICGKASTRPLGDWCRWCGAKMDEVKQNG